MLDEWIPNKYEVDILLYMYFTKFTAISLVVSRLGSDFIFISFGIIQPILVTLKMKYWLSRCEGAPHITLLHIKSLNKTISLIFFHLCVLCFQSHPLRFFVWLSVSWSITNALRGMSLFNFCHFLGTSISRRHSVLQTHISNFISFGIIEPILVTLKIEYMYHLSQC